MNGSYLNAIADYGASLITHIGLVDELDVEISGGAYARQPVTWTTATNGIIRPSADLTFLIPAGATVSGWRGFSALTAGTNYGGENFTTPETFANAGDYKLTALTTGIIHQ